MRSALLALGLVLAAAFPTAEGRRKNGTGKTYSVRAFGARGDGATLDGPSIQNGINQLKPGDTLHFPEGTYLVDSVVGIKLKDDITLDLGSAVVTAQNVSGARCRIFDASATTGVEIHGGTLVGSRSGNPQWGVGIIASDAESLLIDGTHFRDFFFDGILLTGNKGCKKVIVRNVTSSNNRRTGLAIPAADDVTVEDSTFEGSNGQSPQAGVNCEPGPGAQVTNVKFERCTFSKNAGVGIYLHKALGITVENASVEDSTVDSNLQGIVASGVENVTIVGNTVVHQRENATSGIALGDGTTGVLVSGNHLEDNYRGIMAAGATGVQIRGNTIEPGSASPPPDSGQEGAPPLPSPSPMPLPSASPTPTVPGDCITCRGLKGILANACVIANNTVRGCPGSAVVVELVSHVQLLENTVETAGFSGVLLRSVSDSEARGNEISGSGGGSPGHYDGIELVQSSNNNVVRTNVIHKSNAMRNPVGVGPGCVGNQLIDNVVKP
jgi:nitrous oxidase accessory protein NosD